MGSPVLVEEAEWRFRELVARPQAGRAHGGFRKLPAFRVCRPSLSTVYSLVVFLLLNEGVGISCFQDCFQFLERENTDF